jgi:2-polyprenyl-3-methyl-5-hydroxy-6-metoxy-1,4-benzoquinol methylase
MTPGTPTSIPAPEPSSTVIPLRQRGPSDVTAAAVDLHDLNSPHTLAVLSIPPTAAVLDVGCGPGIVARALAERGCRVWGIEIDPRKAAVARASCVEVVEADLETVSPPTLFGGQRFDAILCLDVLEHLRNPASTLTELRSMLAPGGTVLISIPNVTHGALRLELLQGRFAYRSSGLLDHGHLRFFDAKALAELIRTAGLRAETTLRVIKRLDQTEFEVDLRAIPPAFREMLEQDPDALTYQFFVIARPVQDGQPTGETASLPERLRWRVDEVTAELDKAGSYARTLESQLQAKDEQIRNVVGQATQIAALTAELEKGAAYARQLEAQIEGAGIYGRRLEAELAASHARAEAQSAAEQSLRTHSQEVLEKANALEGLVADLRRLLDDQVSYAHYLETELQKRAGELAIRGDELHVLRTHVAKTEQAIADRDAQLHAADAALSGAHADLHRRRVEIARHEDELGVLRDALDAARHTVVGREGDLEVAARAAVDAAVALAEERRHVAELSDLIRQHRARLAARAADAFVQRAPGLYRLLRPVLRAALERERPAERPR